MWTSIFTRPSLLLRLRDSKDERAWDDFIDAYAPLIYGYCRRRGLQDADANDVLQETLKSVARAIASFDYDPGRGRFRDWIFAVTRSKLMNLHSKGHASNEVHGSAAVHRLLESTPDEKAEAEWNRAWDLQVFAWAAERTRGQFREATWRAFWETGVRFRPATEVAVELGMTLGAVYIAKSRGIARLRSLIDSVDGGVAEGESREPSALSS